jgi:hypothetical protein
MKTFVRCVLLAATVQLKNISDNSLLRLQDDALSIRLSFRCRSYSGKMGRLTGTHRTFPILLSFKQLA